MKSLLGSSLKANAVQHTSGRVQGRAIPRREGEPEADTYIDRPAAGPVEILRWRFDLLKGLPLVALSPRDRFTTRLSYRYGMVLAQGRADVSEEIAGTTLVEGPPERWTRRRSPRRVAYAVREPIQFAPVTLVQWADKPGLIAEVASGVVVNVGWWAIVTPQSEVQP